MEGVGRPVAGQRRDQQTGAEKSQAAANKDGTRQSGAGLGDAAVPTAGLDYGEGKRRQHRAQRINDDALPFKDCARGRRGEGGAAAAR